MGTSLTGLTPAATYDGLLKTTDNEAIGATEKVVTDGLGNNSALQVGTTSASVQGGFQVTGTLKDSSGDVGSSGQFLSSSGTGTNWIEVSIPAGVFEAGSGTDSVQAVAGSASASGDYSFAIGNFTTASGNYSTAISSGSTASGYMSNVMGINSTASGDYSTVIGNYSTCAIAESVVIGNAITANRGSTTHVNNLSIMNIPTSAAGLPSGAVWRNGTALNIVP